MNAIGRVPTTKQYARVVLEESLVNGVPNIVRTPSLFRKVFKAIVLVACLVGFIYQTTVFISFILTYPSVVDIQVLLEKDITLPAITICNNNGIKRSKYCEMYQENCETPPNKTLFCEQYPLYCREVDDWKNFKIPKAEYLDFEQQASVDDFKLLGHDLNSFLEATDSEIDERDLKEDVQGPFIFTRSDATMFMCYSMFSRVESSQIPYALARERSIPVYISFLEMMFDFEENETFIPSRKPGGLISVHSPFDLVNPNLDGHSLRPGANYKIHLTIEEEELLPHPYSTNCTNYTQDWLDRDTKGPRSQEMCKMECFLDFFDKMCNCTPPLEVFYIRNKPCTDECPDFEGREEEFNDVLTCTSNCGNDCKKYKFAYEVQETMERAKIFGKQDRNGSRKTTVKFYAKNPEVIVFKHRPQYQSIEIFSYIGGYIGAWLGISLVAVVDFVESLSLIVAFVFKKRQENGSSIEIEGVNEEKSQDVALQNTCDL